MTSMRKSSSNPRPGTRPASDVATDQSPARVQLERLCFAEQVQMLRPQSQSYESQSARLRPRQPTNGTTTIDLMALARGGVGGGGGRLVVGLYDDYANAAEMQEGPLDKAFRLLGGQRDTNTNDTIQLVKTGR